MSWRARERKALSRAARRYEKAKRWAPWDATEVFRRLRTAGCTCRDQVEPRLTLPNGERIGIAPGISMDSYETVGNPNSYRARHGCHGCGRTIFESENEHRCITCAAWIDTGELCASCRNAITHDRPT